MTYNMPNHTLGASAQASDDGKTMVVRITNMDMQNAATVELVRLSSVLCLFLLGRWQHGQGCRKRRLSALPQVGFAGAA